MGGETAHQFFGMRWAFFRRQRDSTLALAPSSAACSTACAMSLPILGTDQAVLHRYRAVVAHMHDTACLRHQFGRPYAEGYATA